MTQEIVNPSTDSSSDSSTSALTESSSVSLTSTLTNESSIHKRAAVDHPAWALVGLALALAFVVTAAVFNQSQLFVVSGYDTYALQAQAWREGMTHLSGDVPHLELAIFGGEYYVSFPPVPTVPIWLLSWVMPGGVPSGLLTVVYFLLCYPLAYGLGRRYVSALGSAALAFATLVGGSFLDVAVSGSQFSGGVWYQAQVLGTLLTLCAFYGVPHSQKRWRFFGWLAIAMAVGCRPFQGIYIPVLMWLQWKTRSACSNADVKVGVIDDVKVDVIDDVKYDTVEKRSLIPWFARNILPYWIAPMIVAAAMGWYNWIRFGSVLEFGHNYLPEFNRPGQVQFSLSHIVQNLFNILRPPFVEYSPDGSAALFPLTLGFAVYLTQPMLTDASASLIRRKPDTGDCHLLAALAVHFILLLLHRTFGGWQYGARYICDMLPGLLALRLRSRRDPGVLECVFLLLLAGCNLAGTILFHIFSGI
ncbi:hypothetical protein FACS1894184_02050 [Clostridia bacterium]|nr:hypothetical protein FACS1894184_02050 [Clostridia bacterium]